MPSIAYMGNNLLITESMFFSLMTSSLEELNFKKRRENIKNQTYYNLFLQFSPAVLPSHSVLKIEETLTLSFILKEMTTKKNLSGQENNIIILHFSKTRVSSSEVN